MATLNDHALVLKLIDELEPVANELTAKERELLANLKAKYSEFGQGDFDDKICLEVMQRNIGIRRSYNMDAERDTTRVIDLPRRGRPS